MLLHIHFAHLQCCSLSLVLILSGPETAQKRYYTALFFIRAVIEHPRLYIAAEHNSPMSAHYNPKAARPPGPKTRRTLTYDLPVSLIRC